MADEPDRIPEGVLREPYADPLTEAMSRRLLWAEATILQLRAQVQGHAERIAAQSEILSRRAERPDQKGGA